MSIGNNIKIYRKKAGLTQVQLSALANISRSYLGDVEGDRYNPSIETLQALAHALGVDTSFLIGESNLINSDPFIPDIDDAYIREIRRGLARASVKDREKALRILELAFEDAFSR